MLAQVQEQTGIVTGITTITGERVFDRLQAIEWLYSLGLIAVPLGLETACFGDGQ